MPTFLVQAREHVARGDLVSALEATLEAWRTSRDPDLAALVAILSDRILAPRKSLGKGIRDPEKWLEAAKDPPADLVGRLAPTLFAVKQLAAKKRFQSVEDWRSDPRMSRALEAGLLKPPWVGRGMQVEWGIVFAQCVRNADTALATTLEKLNVEEYRRGTSRDTNVWMTAQCGEAARAARALLATMTPCDPAERDALAREVAATERGTARGERSEQELLDAIWTDPESDEKRLVYGDHLLERGDPRGELIALQFKELEGKATPEDVTRVEALCDKHLRALLGPLHGGIDTETAVFERGFLARASIAIRLKKDVARLRGHHAWGTLRKLRAARGREAIEPGFYGEGVFLDLRTIWGLEAESARALLSSPPPKLEAFSADVGGVTAAALDTMKSLRRLYLEEPSTSPELESFIEPLSSQRARSLDRIVLKFDTMLGEGTGALGVWLPFLLAHDPGCRELVKAYFRILDPEIFGTQFVLRHDERGRRTILEIGLGREDTDTAAREKYVDRFYLRTAAELERLDPGLLTEITVTSSRPGTAAHAAFEAAAKRQPLTRLEMPATRL